MNSNIDRLTLGGVSAHVFDVRFSPGGITFQADFYGPHEALLGPVNVYTTDGEIFSEGVNVHTVPRGHLGQRTTLHYTVHVTMLAEHNFDYETA